MKREYRGLSQRTRALLELPETVNTDFKREVAAISSSDLVAFANSPQGGTLLIGVDEYTDANGVQRGRIVGCDVDDNARLVLINKATDCLPTVDIEIVIENLAAKPILRIEIPTGMAKPYCTRRGIYSIRTEGRNRALYPEELLEIFMEREGEQFLSRFRHAVFQLEHQVGGISHSLSQGMLELSGHIGDLDDQLRRTLSRIDQFSDSHKKRTRNLLQSVRESQMSITNLEQLFKSEQDQSHERQALDQLRDLEAKLALLIEAVNSENGHEHFDHTFE